MITKSEHTIWAAYFSSSIFMQWCVLLPTFVISQQLQVYSCACRTPADQCVICVILHTFSQMCPCLLLVSAPKVTWAPTNNKHGHIWLKVWSITRMTHWSAGARQAHEQTCSRWRTTKVGNNTHHCMNIDDEKYAAQRLCSLLVIIPLH